ncbi:MAG: hypothetical protein KGJ13_03895 [Patescibacteria group bacterium]|nr:hypothetical protein [Patescibacteria group bacterium]
MADPEPVINPLKFTCPCGGESQNFNCIALTDQHEEIIFFICSQCGKQVYFRARLTDLWKACPPHLSAQPDTRVPIQETVSPADPQPLKLTTQDAKFMHLLRIRIDP